MRDELSSAQIDSYRENGFLVVDGFLDDAETRHWRTALEDAVRERGDARLPSEPDEPQADEGGERRPLDGLRLREALAKHSRSWVRVLSQHVNLWQTDGRVRDLVLDPRLGRIACELADVGGVRIWHDQTMFKPAWGEPTGWHTDSPVFSFTHPGASTFWFALVDADLRNGCMHYLPGSHKARVTTKGNMRLDGLRNLNPEWEFAEPVPCPVRAGSLIVHGGDTAHAAGANMTPRPRPAFAISWMPAGATFNGTPNILPRRLLATLRVGDSLDIDDQCPLVHSR